MGDRDIGAEFHIRKHARLNGVPEEEALAIAEQETGFRGLDPNSISPAGALGSMQIMPKTAGPDADLSTTEGQIAAGIKELARLRQKHGPEKAPIAYHGGEGALKNPYKSYDRYAGITSGAYRDQVRARLRGQLGLSRDLGAEFLAAKRNMVNPEALTTWQQFEKDKQSGNIEAANAAVPKLKEFGFEAGPGEGGFPYAKPPAQYQRALDKAALPFLNEQIKNLGGFLSGRAKEGIPVSPTGQSAMQLIEYTRMRDDILRRQRGEPTVPTPPTRIGQLPYEGPKGLKADLLYGPTALVSSLQSLGSVGTKIARGVYQSGAEAVGLEGNDTPFDPAITAQEEALKGTDRTLGELQQAGTPGLKGSALRGASDIAAKLPLFALLGALSGGGAAAETATFGAFGGLEAAGRSGPVDPRNIAKGALANAIPIPFIKGVAREGRLTRALTGGAIGTATGLATGQPLDESLVSGGLFAALSGLPKTAPRPAPKPIGEAGPRFVGRPEGSGLMFDLPEQGKVGYRESPVVLGEEPIPGPNVPIRAQFAEPGQAAVTRFQILDRSGRVLGDVLDFAEAEKVVATEGAGKGWAIQGIKPIPPPEIANPVPTRPTTLMSEPVRRGPLLGVSAISGARVDEPMSPRPEIIGEPGLRIAGKPSLTNAKSLDISPKPIPRSETEGGYLITNRDRYGRPSGTQVAPSLEEAQRVAAETAGSDIEPLRRRENIPPVGIGGVEPPTAKPKFVADAEARLAEQQRKVESGELKEFGSGGPGTPELLDRATVLGYKVYQSVKDKASWVAEMVRNFGDAIRAHVDELWTQITGKPDFRYNQDRNQIIANPPGMKLFNRLAGQSTGQDIAGAEGYSLTETHIRPLLEVVEKARQKPIGPSKQIALGSLAAQLKQSGSSGPLAIAGVPKGNLFGVRTALLHEGIHQADQIMAQQLGGKIPRSIDFADIPHWDAIQNTLKKDSHYASMGPNGMAMEAAAYVGSGKPEKVGLSPEQGVEFIRGYFDLKAKFYGPKWLDIYGRMTSKAKVELEAAKQRVGEKQPTNVEQSVAEVLSSDSPLDLALQTSNNESLKNIKGLFRGVGSALRKSLDASRWLDNQLRPINRDIERQVASSIGAKLPDRVKSLIAENPDFKNAVNESLTRVNELKQQLQGSVNQVKELTGTKQGILSFFSRPNAAPEELLIADRIARGVPADLTSLPPEKQAMVLDIAANVKALAQELTGIRQSLGLPVRDVWLQGAKYWYPALYAPKNPFSASMIAGKLYATWANVAKPSAAETKRVFTPRTSDRFSIVDQRGKLAEKEDGGYHLYDTAAEAEAAAKNLPRQKYEVEFFDKGEPKRSNRKVTSFDSISERRKWMDENAGPDGSIEVIRTLDPTKKYQVLAPMTHEMSVAHGLNEDIFANLQKGFGNEIETLKRVMILDKIGARMAVDTPSEGYGRLSDFGVQIPAKLIESNPNIKRLAQGYVPKDLGRSFVAFYGKNNMISRVYRAIENNYFRKFSTVFNFPFRHIKQLAENELALGFAHPEASINLVSRKRSLQSFYEGAVLQKSTDPTWKEFSTDPDMVNADMLHGDLRNVWGNLSDDLAGNGSLSLMDNLLASGGKIGDIAKQGKDAIEWLYGAEDQIYRFHLYKYLRENGGMNAAEAKARVQESFFDHYNLPPVVRMLNRYVPFSPTTNYNFARIIYQNFRDRPAETMVKTSLLAMGYSYMRDQLMDLAGVDPKDLEKLGKNAPKWYQLILPYTNSKGENFTLDMSWLIPFGNEMQLADIFKEKNLGEAVHSGVRRYLPLTVQPVITGLAQKDVFGRNLVSDTERKTIGGGEEMLRIVENMAKQSIPGAMGQFWDKMYMRADEGEGRSQPWLQYLGSRTVGQINKLDIESKKALEQAIEEGRTRAIGEETNAVRGKMLRGEITSEAAGEKAEALKARTENPSNYDPLVLLAAEEVEKADAGQPNKEREAFDNLMDSGKFVHLDDAEDMVYQLVDRRQALKELQGLPEGTYNIIEEAAQQQAETGRVAKDSALNKLLDSLDDNMFNAVMDRLDARTEEYKARMNRKAASAKQ